MERCVNRIQSALIAQDPPLKLAQTRLKKRSRRPEVENCADDPHFKLVESVNEIVQCIKLLESKLEEAQKAHQELIDNKTRLESAMRVKKNSLLIDQQKCMSKRRTFPYIAHSTRYF